MSTTEEIEDVNSVLQKPKRNWKSIIINSAFVLIIGFFLFGYWYSTTPQYQAYKVQKDLTEGVASGKGCDVKDANGALTHLSVEECANYLQIQTVIRDGMKQQAEQESNTAKWQAEKKNITQEVNIQVPLDWKSYSNPQLGITLHYPEKGGYQSKLNSYNTLLYLVKGAADPNATIEWYIHKGSSVCDITGQHYENSLKWMSAPSAKPVVIGGASGKIVYSGEYGVYVYQAYVNQNNSNRLYTITLQSSKENEVLFRQILAGISFSEPQDMGIIESACK